MLMVRMTDLLLVVFVTFYIAQVSADGIPDKCQIFYDDAAYKQAYIACLPLAVNGDVNAQTIIGELYDLGRGVDKDVEQARRWWQQAADNGHLEAQNFLALKYYYGGTVLGKEDGWPQDYSKAMKIWRESAEKGVVTSQFMVGMMYHLGQGVPQDYAKSYAWMKLAYQGGYKLALEVIVELSRIMSQQQRQQGMVLLEQYRQKYTLQQ